MRIDVRKIYRMSQEVRMLFDRMRKGGNDSDRDMSAKTRTVISGRLRKRGNVIQPSLGVTGSK